MEEDRNKKISVGDLVLIEATGWKGRLGVVEDTLEDGKLLISVFPKSQKKQVSLKPSVLKRLRIDRSRGLPFTKKERVAICWNCSTYVKRKNIKECSRCRTATYCNAQCQRVHWEETFPAHKNACENLRKAKKLVKKLGVLPRNVDIQSCPWIRLHMIENIAERFIEKEEYIAAETLLCDGIKDKEEYGPFYISLSFVVWQQGRHEEAIDLMERGIRLHDDAHTTAGAPLYLSLAGMFNQQGDLEQALKASQQAVKLDPSFVETYYDIGALQHWLNNDDEANASYRKFLKAAGPFHDPNQELAGKAAAAARCLAKSMGTQLEERVQATHLLGVLDMIQEEVQEESKEVVSLLNMAIRLDPPDKVLLKRCLKRHLAFMEDYFEPPCLSWDSLQHSFLSASAQGTTGIAGCVFRATKIEVKTGDDLSHC